MLRLALTIFLCLLPLQAAAQARARDGAMASSAVAAARDPLDACGGRGLLDTAVPNGIFLEACRNHDACFRSGVLDQGRCDADFLFDMREACATHYPGPDTALMHATCQAGAYTYYRAVNSRFGSMLYPDAITSGALGEAVQRRVSYGVGGDQLEVCADVTNTANRKLRFVIALETASGSMIATGPAMLKAALQPGETRQLCVSTLGALLTGFDAVGPTYGVVLKVDDPSTLNPFGDLITLDRLDCETETGTCLSYGS